jgi:hypothetical protein
MTTASAVADLETVNLIGHRCADPERLRSATKAVEQVGEYVIELLQGIEALNNYVYSEAMQADGGEAMLQLVTALGARILNAAKDQGIVEVLDVNGTNQLVPGDWHIVAQDALSHCERAALAGRKAAP